MNKIFQTLSLTLLFILTVFPSFSQEVEMADDFRGEGKIYVVVAVIVTLLVGIFYYLFRLDNKIKKLEKENDSEE